MRRTTLAALAATSLLLAGLAGCGSDPQPKFAKTAPPTPSATVSASPTPTTPTAPQMPAAAKKHTIAGAKAFVAYFVETANYGTSTGDPSLVQAISSTHCDTCQAAIAGIRKRDKQDAVSKGGTWTVSNIRANRTVDGNYQVARVTVTSQVSRQVINYADRKKEIYPAATGSDAFILISTDAGWVIDDWNVTS